MFRKLGNIFGDPRHPSLGPVVTGLKGTCIWPNRSRLQSALYLTTLIFTSFIALNQILYMIYSNDPNFYLNLLQYSVFHTGLVKIISFAKWHSKWEELIEYFSTYELELQKEPRLSKVMEKYVRKSRLIQSFLWGMGLMTNFSNFLKQWITLIRETESSSDVRSKVFFIWWPFDDRERLGCYTDMFVQNLYGDVTSVYVLVWDSLVQTMMIVMAGQLRIVRLRCRHALDSDDEIIQRENLIQCHKHYFSLIKMQALCNSVVSPVIFLHLMIISINFGVIISNLSTYDRAETIQQMVFMAGLMTELCLLYWLANAVTTESELVSEGVYESRWVGCGDKMRRDVLLLSKATSQRLAFRAGPFNEMSLATFVAILRATYSFYTLMDQRK